MKSFGTFALHCRDALTVGGMAGYVESALGADAADHDVDAIVVEFREAINAELAPTGVVLSEVNEEFIGPESAAGTDFGAAVAAVDFWSVVARHRR